MTINSRFMDKNLLFYTGQRKKVIMKRYEYLQPTHSRIWQGRIDDEKDFEAFRWHQWVEPIDLSEMDLPLKGKLNICFIGFCCDKGVERNKGRTGASKGPDSIRSEMRNLPCHFSEDLNLYDAGNIIAKHQTLEEAQVALKGIVNDILALNMFPIVLGGGHEIAFGHYMGLRRFFNHQSIGIVNFDAHLDIRPYPNGGSSGTMFRQIYDHCKKHNHKFGYLCVGAQKRGNTIKLFKDAIKMEAKVLLAKDICEAIPKKEIKDYLTNYDQIYMTICADVFSAAHAPGVSAASAIGLEPEQVITMMKEVIGTGKLCSFDIAEVSPRFDHDKVTSNLAAILIFAVVNALAELRHLTYDTEF